VAGETLLLSSAGQGMALAGGNHGFDLEVSVALVSGKSGC